MGVAPSKQLCSKRVGRELWRYSDMAGHWDKLVTRSSATIDGKRLIAPQSRKQVVELVGKE